MFLLKRSRATLEDTIAAIATPPGSGGIGVIRVSGAKAGYIAHLLF
ncbi:MAG: tRNA uridine-5-carboxymethylaminomethyl(34) synthesis GTPase MnmE, partial [Syntrophobacteraceae bacterium CG23_combo_of_CG06-09_8_20_14_all_50_8]